MYEILDKMSQPSRKHSAGNGTMRHSAAPRLAPRPLTAPMVVVFSADRELTGLVEAAVQSPWKVEHCEDPGIGREALARPNIRLVILDDAAVQEEARGWLLDRIRRLVPQALLIYVANAHSAAEERRARAYAAQFYTAKPLDRDRIQRVIQSFARAATARDSEIAQAKPRHAH